MKISNSRGYTIIELVIVIVLVGILSAVAISRLLRSDTYNPLIVRDQIISMGRLGQQMAIGRSDVVLTIQPAGNQIEIRVSDSNGTIQNALVDGASVALSGEVNQLASCGVTAGTHSITNATPYVLEYNELGDLRRGGVTGSPGFPVAVSTGTRVCVNNNPVMSVCFSAAGYAYAGDCVD